MKKYKNYKYFYIFTIIVQLFHQTIIMDNYLITDLCHIVDLYVPNTTYNILIQLYPVIFTPKTKINKTLKKIMQSKNFLNFIDLYDELINSTNFLNNDYCLKIDPLFCISEFINSNAIMNDNMESILEQTSEDSVNCSIFTLELQSKLNKLSIEYYDKDPDFVDNFLIKCRDILISENDDIFHHDFVSDPKILPKYEQIINRELHKKSYLE